MEIRSHFSALVSERGHHQVQDRAGTADERPQGTDASARQVGAELKGGECEWQQLGRAQGLPTKPWELLPSF